MSRPFLLVRSTVTGLAISSHPIPMCNFTQGFCCLPTPAPPTATPATIFPTILLTFPTENHTSTCYNKCKHPSATTVIAEETSDSAECDLHLWSPPPA
uniref:Uncharacterized protein n=1 Tax=Zea mays TaxID=4577 RepID=C0PC29_MAIZE|nr:unknown [Zea mays]